MKLCASCSTSNSDGARFCSDCGAALVTLPAAAVAETKPLTATAPATTGGGKGIDAASLAKAITMRGDTVQSKRKADIMFVLDCTGSMQGEIDAIRDGIMGFADTIVSDGVRARVGMIEFRDRLIDEEQRVLTFGGEVFTQDPESFRREVSALRASGGGDAPESSLDALMLATRQPFGVDANRVIVLITDAPPHIPDRETRSIDEVLRAFTDADIHECYLVMRTGDPDSLVYLKLLEGRKRSLAFDLGKGDDFRTRYEHFKRTLMALGKTISVPTMPIA